MYALYHFRTAIGFIISIIYPLNPLSFLVPWIFLLYMSYLSSSLREIADIEIELKVLELAKSLVELERMDRALEAAKIALSEEIKTELKAIDLAKQLIKLEAIDAEKAEIAEANKKMWDWVNARVEATTPECEKKWARKQSKHLS